MCRTCEVLHDPHLRGPQISAKKQKTNPVTLGLMADIRWFLGYTQEYNGLVLMKKEPRRDWIIECDVCMMGVGVYSETNYVHEYQEDHRRYGTNITHLESLDGSGHQGSRSPRPKQLPPSNQHRQPGEPTSTQLGSGEGHGPGPLRP